jgi:hypothetical protein
MLGDWLASRKGLVDEHYAAADIGALAYVSTTDMDGFPSIRNRLARVKAQPS